MPIRNRRTAAAVALIAAACAVTLTACGPDNSAPSAAPSSQDGNGSVLGSNGGATQPQAADTSAPSANSGSDSGGSGSGSRCHTQNLKIEFATGGDALPDLKANQTSTDVAVTNVGSNACTIAGFPGVDLNGSPTWSLQRSKKGFTPTTLGHGDTTDFTIHFLPEPGGDYDPGTVTITPPNETSNVKIAWPWGPVLEQDSATHPGTFVDPVGASS
jgi:hypothetical protein